MKTLVQHTYNVYGIAVKWHAHNIHDNDETQIFQHTPAKYLIHFLPSYLPGFTEQVQTEYCSQKWFNNSLSKHTTSQVFKAVTQVLFYFYF